MGPLDLGQTLLAFIQAAQDAPRQSERLHSLSIHIADAKWMTLQFGYGYFNPSKVLVTIDDEIIGEAEPEEAVKAYCEGRAPVVVKH